MIKFSIITATLNSEQTIKDTINSVKQQSYKSYEHIIIDSSSNNKTIKKSRSILHKRMRIIKFPSRGIYKAFNKGIKLSKGKFIIFLNSDDCFYNNNVLKKLNEKINKYKFCSIFYGNLIIISKLNKIIRVWNSCNFKPELFAKGWSPPHPSFIVKKEIYLKYGFYFQNNGDLAKDVELMVRYLGYFKLKSKYLNMITTKMRAGGISNKNITNIIKQNIYIIKILKKYQLFEGYFHYFYNKFLIKLNEFKF